MSALQDGKPDSVEAVQYGLKATGGYVCTKEIATTVYLACHMAKPILIEFESYPLEEAIARIETGSGFRVTMGLTDYGRAL